MSNIAIRIENVSKQYRLGLVSTKTLVGDLHRWWTMRIKGQEDPYLKVGDINDRASRAESDYVWALKDINMEIEQGSLVGIIGKNGAGKSTLLKLLSKVTKPTTGTIQYKGRISSLLEVGTGFHPELTGRENIYMNGAIMGMTRAEITKKLDEIIDFSGCERYIDTPVKRYSSGMTVRLGFAVAAHLEPDILVVDEVLAVGDAEFQKKAIGKMQNIGKGEGRTVLFVSHNMAAVRNLCQKGVVLKNGMIDYIGSAEDCIEYYIQSNEITEVVCATKIDASNRRASNNLLEVEFLEVKLLNDAANIGSDESLLIEAKLKRNNPSITKCQYTVSIKNENDEIVQGFLTNPIDVPEQNDIFSIRLKVNNHGLTKRKYKVDLVAGIKDFSIGSRNYDRVENVIIFDLKYYNIRDRREYMVWNKNWGPILHNGELIEVSVL